LCQSDGTDNTVPDMSLKTLAMWWIGMQVLMLHIGVIVKRFTEWPLGNTLSGRESVVDIRESGVFRNHHVIC
jgi:dolichyl-phosphate-mannose--protein O-mannosyl transferase